MLAMTTCSSMRMKPRRRIRLNSKVMETTTRALHIRPTKWKKVGDLGVMMEALTILQKRYARPLRFH